MINAASPSIEVSLNGDMMTIKESALIFTSENTFKLGQEYDEQMPRTKIKVFIIIVYLLKYIYSFIQNIFII